MYQGDSKEELDGHEKFVMFFTRRIGGPAFFVGGFIVAGVMLYQESSIAIDFVQGDFSAGEGMRLVKVLAPLLVAFLGLLLMRAKKYKR